MALSLRIAALISTSIQAILYGCAVLMFIWTIWILWQKSRHSLRALNYKMITAASVLLLLATAQMIVNVVRICHGFVSVGPRLPGGPEQFFADVTETTFVAKISLCNTQTLILDGIVIYRTYVVWQNFYVVIIPILGWCSLLASAIGTNIALATSSDSGNVFFVETGLWITANYASTLATNLSSSILLAYRIWKLNRRVAAFGPKGQLNPVIRAVVESGMIYSLTVTGGLLTFVLETNGVYVILDMISPIILIVFCMIVVRIGMLTHSSKLKTSISRTLGGQLASNPVIVLGRQDGNLYDMKALEVEVTQYRKMESDRGTVKDIDIEQGQGAGGTFAI